MAERDITGHVVQGSLKRIARLRARMHTRIPYGPLRQQLTSQEARKMIQNMDPIAKQDFIKRVGDEEWRRMMEEFDGK